MAVSGRAYRSIDARAGFEEGKPILGWDSDGFRDIRSEPKPELSLGFLKWRVTQDKTATVYVIELLL
jgi:hypothetical protein